ncbi:uracil-DNA glycosylase family protein [Cupriavidus cauae]|uniref:uracil-DNA glycosylase family protein n=1 Tax=Cupriavidus cauae TaxID=2608999 RepID=UPI0022433919|nr:uracil-DNA glycosylase family protein [Cupriavidus cauae]UZN52124.1 uracil-DNA glycosylase family protein [Cupriavidus cauae]
MKAQRITNLDTLLSEVRACRACEPDLPLGARPVLQASPQSRILIVGQAPGTKVHQTGIPWNDASGKRLREWLGVDAETFYDPTRFAIVPMGLCYPGRAASGDKPPRPECAPMWMDRILAGLEHIELTLLVGLHAQRYFLGAANKPSLTETVMAWAEYGPRYVPLPHPSPRNVAWFQRNAWFGEEVVPMLKTRVAEVLENDGVNEAEKAAPRRIAAKPRP